MKFFHLIWRNLLRRKIRTILTIASIFIAFLLFGVLMAIRTAFSMGVDIAGADRLMSIHKVSLIQLLPRAYLDRIRSLDGVSAVTHANWFGAYYQEPSNFIANFAVEPDAYMKMYPEFEMPEEQKKAWIANRAGAVVGIDTARKFGWKVGDHVALISPIYRKRDGSPWDFTIEGIYDSPVKGVDKTQFFFNYDYVNETFRDTPVANLVGWYIIRVADPSASDQLAKKVDALFANSSAETKTATEKAFVSDFAKQVGDIGAIMVAILVAVLFTMMLVAANTMAQSVRERTSEVGVLKTLGFSNTSILLLVLGEAVLITVIGGGLGLLVAWLFVQQGDPTGGMLPIFMLPQRDVVLGAVLILGLGLVAGALPAFNAMNLKITDALRRN